MLKPTITLDTSGWKEAATNLFRTEMTKSIVDFINGHSYRVITWAIKFTEKADRREIERFMMSEIVSEKSVGGGWVRIKRNIYDKTVAARMLGAYWRKYGEWPVHGATHEDRIKRLVAVKVKSVAMMKAGWINAANALRKVIYRDAGPNTTKFGGKHLGGYAVPARFTLFGRIEATFANEAPGYQRARRQEKAWTGELGDPMPVLIAGLQIALDSAQASMERKLAERLKRDLSRFGVR